MNVEDYKTLIILFEPGQGGNHLANLVSTSPKVHDRFVTDNYQQYLLEQYQSPSTNAHYGEINGFESTNPVKLISYINSTPRPVVLCGHLAETYHIINLIRWHGPVCLINFENFNLNDLAVSRMKVNIRSVGQLLEWAHRSEIVASTFNINSDNLMAIQTNDLFQENITDLLQRISVDLKLDLDLEFCQTLHSLWFKRITQ